MNTTTISDILNLPDNTAIDSVQGKITEVYAAREVNGKPVQDGKLSDGTKELKITFWGHNDTSVFKGREVIIQAGPKGGLKVKLDTYKGRNTNTISISSFCTIQPIEVHNGNKAIPTASAPKPVSSPSAPVQAPTMTINGAKIGMCVNNAVLFMTTAGEAFTAERLHEIASQILHVSVRLENGDIAKEVKAESIPY